MSKLFLSDLLILIPFNDRLSEYRHVRCVRFCFSFFTFICHVGVEATNNLAERLIRPGVQTRKTSYCTRSDNGRLLRARLLTVSQTRRIQQRNALDFYRTAIAADRNNLTVPSLLTQPLRMAA
jgi:hypothetical protein